MWDGIHEGQDLGRRAVDLLLRSSIEKVQMGEEILDVHIGLCSCTCMQGFVCMSAPRTYYVLMWPHK